MNDIETPNSAKRSKTANLIDDNLAKAAATLEDIAERIARVGAEGDVPLSFTSSAVGQIESFKRRLQSVDGEVLVERSKETIERHPKALAIAGAIVGAALAQVAVVVVRKERRRATQQQAA